MPVTLLGPGLGASYFKKTAPDIDRLQIDDNYYPVITTKSGRQVRMSVPSLTRTERKEKSLEEWAIYVINATKKVDFSDSGKLDGKRVKVSGVLSTKDKGKTPAVTKRPRDGSLTPDDDDSIYSARTHLDNAPKIRDIKPEFVARLIAEVDARAERIRWEYGDLIRRRYGDVCAYANELTEATADNKYAIKAQEVLEDAMKGEGLHITKEKQDEILSALRDRLEQHVVNAFREWVILAADESLAHGRFALIDCVHSNPERRAIGRRQLTDRAAAEIDARFPHDYDSDKDPVKDKALRDRINWQTLRRDALDRIIAERIKVAVEARASQKTWTNWFWGKVWNGAYEIYRPIRFVASPLVSW